MAKTPAEKLGIKPGDVLIVQNAPEGGLDLLEPLPNGVDVQTRESLSRADVVVLFVADASELHRDAPAILTGASDKTRVWIAYRKGGASDLSRDTLMPAFTALGWHGVSLVSLDSRWSAGRFRRLDQIGH